MPPDMMPSFVGVIAASAAVGLLLGLLVQILPSRIQRRVERLVFGSVVALAFRSVSRSGVSPIALFRLCVFALPGALSFSLVRFVSGRRQDVPSNPGEQPVAAPAAPEYKPID